MTYDATTFKQDLQDRGDRSTAIIRRDIQTKSIGIGYGKAILTFDQLPDDGMWDLSHLGECGSSPQAYAVDRQDRIVLGEYTERTYWLTAEEGAGLSDGQMETALIRKAESDGFDLDASCNSVFFETQIDMNEDDVPGVAMLEVLGYPIIAKGLRYGDRDRGDRYFYPEYAESYHSEAERLADRADLVRIITEDYNRFETAGEQWELVGLAVTAYYKGHEVARASIWGVESDSGERHLAGLYAELVADLDIAKGIESLKEHLRAELAELGV